MRRSFFLPYAVAAGRSRPFRGCRRSRLSSAAVRLAALRETARRLRKAGVERIVGIEPDPDDAAEASRLCDRVLTRPLEEVAEEFPGQFDAVLFGDVLEHIKDPSAALDRVRPWLSPR